MDKSEFRKFCYDKWYEYKDEVEQWEKRVVTGSPSDYFNSWKWFLKAKFKAERCTLLRWKLGDRCVVWAAWGSGLFHGGGY